MSAADDRQRAIVEEVRDIIQIYRFADKEEIVTLFAEDYDFLDKRDQIDSLGLVKGMKVVRGQRKRKKRKKRPPEFTFGHRPETS